MVRVGGLGEKDKGVLDFKVSKVGHKLTYVVAEQEGELKEDEVITDGRSKYHHPGSHQSKRLG